MIIFFKDLKEEVQQGVIDEIRKENANDIMQVRMEAISDGKNPDDYEEEFVENYINIHNIGVSFKM